MPTTLRSFAKINLGLAIGPVRADGFHSLLTLYQTIGLYDLVTVTARRLPAASTQSRLSLTSTNSRVPCDARNTAWRIVASALERLDMRAEVHVHIEKRLPIQGGLGAGSANAAAALIALERELDVVLPQEDRLSLAAHVGSDVPLFLIGGTVLGTGRGELVEPVHDLSPTVCVIATPEAGVSTPRAFQAWDALHQELTSAAKTTNLGLLGEAYKRLSSASLGSDVASPLFTQNILNDFETVVFEQHPALSEIKRVLLDTPLRDAALYASLSGSGSALFGLYRSRAAALAAQKRLQQANVRSLLTETLPRSAYWAKMIAETPDRP